MARTLTSIAQDLVNPPISPLPNYTKNALGNVGGDLYGALAVSPPGDLAQRLAGGGKLDSMTQLQNLLGALRVVGATTSPIFTAGGGALGAGKQAVDNVRKNRKITENVLPAGIESARQAALIPLAMKLLGGINSPQLRQTMRDGGMPQLKRQTLIDNILSKFKK